MFNIFYKNIYKFKICYIQSNDSCTGLFLYSNGEIASMGCNGERSCAGANIISEAQTNGTTVYCYFFFVFI